MASIDHVAVETARPRETAAFYERVLGARIVAEAGHPVMAYLGVTGFAFHEPGGPGGHTAVRVSNGERARIAQCLDEDGVEHWERDHGSPSASSSATRKAASSRPSRTAPGATRVA